jgi:hypothetical protein
MERKFNIYTLTEGEEMDHTPGPWEARKGDVFNPDRTWGVVKPMSLQECQEIDGDDAVAGKRSVVIAEIMAADNGTDEADARLFAAAPELLAALKGMMSLFLGVWDEMACHARGGPDAVNQVADNAHAAINKAEGKVK